MWATPTMSLPHLLFAAASTAYILIAIQLEERNLCEYHPEYAEYRRSVPMLIPIPGRVWKRARTALASTRRNPKWPTCSSAGIWSPLRWWTRRRSSWA